MWPAIAIVVAAAVGVLVALLDVRLPRGREAAEPVDEIVLPAEPAAPQVAASQTVLDQLAAAPEEPGDLRRSA